MKYANTTDTQLEAIVIQHLWAGYDHEMVLENINLWVKELDFIGLIGPNGGGKTTLFKVLLGLLPPMRGKVRIMGMNVIKGRRYIGYVPQTVEFDRDFPINVWDVVLLGRLGKRRLLQPYTTKDNKIVAEALRSVEMLHLSDRPISELSGGQKSGSTSLAPWQRNPKFCCWTNRWQVLTLMQVATLPKFSNS
nr:ATP-binding cassette domain-containing protein [Chroococcidiopsis sp. CCALA 051]